MSLVGQVSHGGGLGLDIVGIIDLTPYSLSVVRSGSTPVPRDTSPLATRDGRRNRTMVLDETT